VKEIASISWNRFSVRMESRRRFICSTGLVLVCLLASVLSAAIDPQNGNQNPEVEKHVEAENSGEADVADVEERSGYLPPMPPYSPVVENIPYPQFHDVGNEANEGFNSAFGPSGSAFHDIMDGPLEIPMRLIDTHVNCEKSYMDVYFTLSRPFYGYIYPYGNFDKCVLFVGRGETEVKLTMSHDICGAPPQPKIPGYSLRINPVIEHRLMIQWDIDLVQEYDTNVLVRCDRPDDYNKTVKFDLSSVVGEQQAAIVNTHPGPQMWMEVQRGEGPRSAPLLGPVYLGETLSLVFTLSDDVFKFDANVVNCWASDGNSERKLVTTQEGYLGAAARPMMTQIPVVENTCSIKPRLFGHFQKVNEEFTNAMTTTQWVLFKAFRFPTSSQILVQCDIEVCYDKCHTLPACGIPFDPRSKNQRKRRDADSDYSSRKPPVQPEVLTMFRAIEVFLPDDGAVPMAMFNGTTVTRSSLQSPECLSTTTFYGVILGLGIALLILIVVAAGYIQRLKQESTKT